MAKLIRVYDPNEKERKINLNIPEDACPGLLEFMSELPYGNDTPLIRGVFYQWYLRNLEAGTLDEALNEVLAGPGGLIPTGRQSRREAAPQPSRKKRMPRQREVTARALTGTSPSAGVHSDDQTSPGHQPTGRGLDALEPKGGDSHPAETVGSMATESAHSPVLDQVVAAPLPPSIGEAATNAGPTAAQPGLLQDREEELAQPNPPESPIPDADQMAVLNSMGAMFG
ncbi:hypothetical protein [Pseudomonas abietaniphila]|uniref:Uncharacterized protein n=1 Tax=Pseudomonas abietaniphila TaxID=89065 RepID=A0A1G8RUQ9_9PSED|nr:hypothetical protein [Pseudomonas abietaniphila]SDJ20804.1 hypothetical protein SAMN05216605_12366 [Pseudomonas abietaniphila]